MNEQINRIESQIVNCRKTLEEVRERRNEYTKLLEEVEANTPQYELLCARVENYNRVIDSTERMLRYFEDLLKNLAAES